MSPNGLGWIIVDSLDTLMIMNLTSYLSDARKWIHRELSYDQDQDVNTFETTILCSEGSFLRIILRLSYSDLLLEGTMFICPRQWTWQTDFMAPMNLDLGFRTRVSI